MLKSQEVQRYVKAGITKNCLTCKKEKYSPVCGKDGKTYFSACTAMNCRGLKMTDYTAGSCQKKASASCYFRLSNLIVYSL